MYTKHRLYDILSLFGFWKFSMALHIFSCAELEEKKKHNYNLVYLYIVYQKLRDLG